MFKPGKYIILHEVFSSNSEAFASELQEHIEEIFLRYYVQNIILSLFISHQCVTRCERINITAKQLLLYFTLSHISHTFLYIQYIYISLYAVYISLCYVYFSVLY